MGSRGSGMDRGGLPPLCGAGRDETRPSSRTAWRTNPTRTARFFQCEGGFQVVRPCGGTRPTASDGGTPSTASPLNGGSLCPGEMPRSPQRTS